MTITEAAACGTPAVATDIAGHRDSVRHELTGLLAADDGTLGEHLVRLVEEPQSRRRFAAAAQREAARLSWERTAHDTLSVLAADAVDRRPR